MGATRLCRLGQLARRQTFSRTSPTRRWQSQQHKTYFQDPLPPPPSPSWGRTVGSLIGISTVMVVWGSICAGVGVYTYSQKLEHGLIYMGEQLKELKGLHDELSSIQDDMQGSALARQCPAVQGDLVTQVMRNNAGFSVTPTVVSHFTQVHSNLPCEDTMGSGTYIFHSEHFKDSKRDWSEWGIYDGHAGPRTSSFLRDALPGFVGGELWEGMCMNRPYTPNDPHIIQTIKKAFLELDHHLLDAVASRLDSGEMSRADMVSLLSNVTSGSCALFAIFDPKHQVMRVANVGDSRAVIGRWDDTLSKYVPKIMSVDQTGFNKAEVERLNKEHPGEDIVDPATGRVHGIMVSRAFGDARWKWPQEINKLVHAKFWGPKPRDDSKILTPPYLTAEPDVMETRVQTGAHPDFMIMASDGFWDQMSNDDAVACVQLWLEQNNPTEFLKKPPNAMHVASSPDKNPLGMFHNKSTDPKPLTYTSAADMVQDEDTYYDEDEGSLKWKTSPKYFVNEDENCGIHLVKNALGGKRRDLMEGVLTVQPPLSRNVRDDITVNVLFFGVDAEKAAQEGGLKPVKKSGSSGSFVSS